MWTEKKGSTRVVENHGNINYSEEMIKSVAGFACSYYEYSYSFLKSCHLCHKPLSGKEIYMYRGEMGFCSEGCRNRQIYLDNMKRIEISTRRILASFHERRRQGGSHCKSKTRGGSLRSRSVPAAAAAPPIFFSCQSREHE